jgi:predicted TPR repeat methyltransferase
MANAPSSSDPNAIERAGELLTKGAAAQAAILLKPLIENGCGGLFARLQFARALSACGAIDEALAAARETALLFSNAAPAALGLGEILLANHQLPTAIAEFQRALRIDPNLSEARFLLGKTWLQAGEPEKALQQLQSIPPADSLTGLPDLVSEAEQMQRAARSNPRYVRHLFDQFSSDYDARMLGQLGYSAPRILRELATLVMPEVAECSLDILDLGCGTGLAAHAFSDLARQIDGVDLSPAMIKKAAARDLYTELTVGDVETLPHRCRYDLIIAADTLVYLGDLAPVFTASQNALRRGGFFLFTVEKNEAEEFALGPKRRWRHSENYLRRMAQASDLQVGGMLACVPRTEAGVPVDGLAVALRKPL